MSLYGKLEGEIEINSPADKFHEVFGFRPHHISNMKAANEKIKGCNLHEGEWGKGKSVIEWGYVHDGKEKISKQVIEEVDHKNYSVTWREIEGDLMEHYKTFLVTIQAIPKGEGSMVHWTFVYERLHEDIPHPTSLLQFVLELSKHVDDHLCEATPEGHSTSAATTA